MNSKHRIQSDGYGHAVDLVPWINGKMRWEWPAIYPICEAMRTSAEKFDVAIRWGGHWNFINGTVDKPERLVENYVAARRAAGKSAFIDGPHYEIILPR